MRRIGVENDPYRKDVLMVISNNSTTYSYERNPNSIHYPRWKPDYEAILPKPMSGMKYSISFINAITQEPDFPSYAKLVFGGEPTCSSHVTEDEVEIIMPAINNRCQSIVRKRRFSDRYCRRPALFVLWAGHSTGRKQHQLLRENEGSQVDKVKC